MQDFEKVNNLTYIFSVDYQHKEMASLLKHFESHDRQPTANGLSNNTKVRFHCKTFRFYYCTW